MDASQVVSENRRSGPWPVNDCSEVDEREEVLSELSRRVAVQPHRFRRPKKFSTLYLVR